MRIHRGRAVSLDVYQLVLRQSSLRSLETLGSLPRHTDHNTVRPRDSDVTDHVTRRDGALLGADVANKRIQTMQSPPRLAAAGQYSTHLLLTNTNNNTRPYEGGEHWKSMSRRNEHGTTGYRRTTTAQRRMKLTTLVISANKRTPESPHSSDHGYMRKYAAEVNFEL